jgi:hypothetical protein
MDQKIRKEIERKFKTISFKVEIKASGMEYKWFKSNPKTKYLKKLFETDESLAQGFADFFKQKVEK